MAQKCRKSRRSSGNKVKINVAREARRQAKFTKKREEGYAYVCMSSKPANPEKKKMYMTGEIPSVKELNITIDNGFPLARMTSIMRKLDNDLIKRKEGFKAAKERKYNNKVKIAW